MKLLKILKRNKKVDVKKATVRVTDLSGSQVFKPADSYVLGATTLKPFQGYIGESFVVDGPIETGNTVTFTLQDQSFEFTHTISRMMTIDEDGAFVVSSPRGMTYFRKVK